MDLKNKRVLVMGLGLHGGGLGVTRWLLKQGARVTVTDLKKADELKSTLDALGNVPQTAQLEFVLGEHREPDFENADLVVRNPGVPRESRYLQIARERGIPIRMELGLFTELLPRGMDQVIGITGTKGKTTTTLMTGAILKRANPKTVVAGNLRVSALELLDQIDADTPVVLEMSSFQLEEFQELKRSPHIAVLTNVYPDHLNRYRDMDEYAWAKAQIFLHQSPRDFVILNFDNPICTRLRPKAIGQVIWFSRTRALKDGALFERDWLVWNEQGKKQNVLPAADLIAGEHNIENALAAMAITHAWGAPLDVIAETLREFRGVPHRLELVRELNGVQYINDTTATAPTATIAALRTFAALKTLAPRGGKIYLIVGGYDKGLPYAEMAKTILETNARVILLDGNATEKIEQALTQANAAAQIIAHAKSLQQAVESGKNAARVGDIVLLSPGAASFGMFVNEFERGDKFREIVRAL
ncbi:MAG: UDP-N-acetylmuramoyl-L-alanine--D-glutamate ligase [Chloroflexi bacterium]|nr:UDP-N-acetylmuramoyl-L-alanine--D-glutamate ligase [Chloroflexota bacterium]